MRGISAEELINFDPWQYENQQDLLNAILKKCHELNTWLPIDENTPKDIEIVALPKFDEATDFQDLGHMASICKFHESAGFCIDELRQPTHWMPLPNAPE